MVSLGAEGTHQCEKISRKYTLVCVEILMWLNMSMSHSESCDGFNYLHTKYVNFSLTYSAINMFNIKVLANTVCKLLQKCAK
jgi:hypothetical protein